MTTTELRLSLQGLKVLKAFSEAYEPVAGADIIRMAHISSGTMYPLLIRFEAAGLIESWWETEQPSVLRRPRRRLYRLTDTGVEFARRNLSLLGVR